MEIESKNGKAPWLVSWKSCVHQWDKGSGPDHPFPCTDSQLVACERVRFWKVLQRLMFLPKGQSRVHLQCVQCPHEPCVLFKQETKLRTVGSVLVLRILERKINFYCSSGTEITYALLTAHAIWWWRPNIPDIYEELLNNRDDLWVLAEKSFHSFQLWQWSLKNRE